MLEPELKSHLKTCGAAYAQAQGVPLTTVGDRVKRDSKFFERLDDPAKTITVRTYDEAMTWFATNWPAGLKWPRGVPKPKVAAEATA